MSGGLFPDLLLDSAAASFVFSASGSMVFSPNAGKNVGAKSVLGDPYGTAVSCTFPNSAKIAREKHGLQNNERPTQASFQKRQGKVR